MARGSRISSLDVHVVLVDAVPSTSSSTFDPSSVSALLELLGHTVEARTAPDPATLLDSTSADLVLVDARYNLAAAKEFCLELSRLNEGVPRVAVTTEGTVHMITSNWRLTDFVLDGCSPAQLHARLIRAVHTHAGPATRPGSSDRSFDDENLAVRLGARTTRFTYREYHLLKQLVRQSNRVLTRTELSLACLTPATASRTIDAMIYRIRRKLGSDGRSIRTVRGIGYQFVSDYHDVDAELPPRDCRPHVASGCRTQAGVLKKRSVPHVVPAAVVATTRQ